MLDARWALSVTIVMLLPAAGCAADEIVADTVAASWRGLTPAAAAMHAPSPTLSGLQSFHAVGAMTGPGDWPRPIANFDFREGSALARVSKLRSLSLLTLAEIGRTRLFLGVNDEGLVGLHFKVLARAGDERYLEVVRMPYLKENNSGPAAGRP
jgi:hypothetical protein